MANGSDFINGALSGAGTGAGIGTAILPGVGTGIGAILGALTGLLGAGLNTPPQVNPPVNLNPYTDSYWNKLNGMGDNFQNQMKQYLATAGKYQGKAGSILDQLASWNKSSPYDPMQATRQFLSLTPQLGDIASSLSGGNNNQALFDQLNKQNAASAAAVLGPGADRSGAFQQMVLDAGAGQRLGFLQNQDNNRMQTFSQLAGNTQNQLGQAYQFAANLKLQALQAAASGNMQLAQQLGGQAQLYQGLLDRVIGSQTSMAQAQWYDPTDVGGQNSNLVSNLAGDANSIIQGLDLNNLNTPQTGNQSALDALLSGNGGNLNLNDLVSQLLASQNQGPNVGFPSIGINP